MKIHLPQTLAQRLELALAKSAHWEIGGVLMGEHLGEDNFDIVDLSVQFSGGSAAHFVRDPHQCKVALEQFFARTEHDYRRFNYLGEWHSHPAMEALPSTVDVATMQSLVAEELLGANFALLLVVSRIADKRLHVSSCVFEKGRVPRGVKLSIEHDNSAKGVVIDVLAFDPVSTERGQ
jgi:proteasome lid subunit RPN8/RPN11